jgi:hypothetical protein
MAKLRSIVLRNYRRFTGEIELPLDPGINLITMPAGQGKTTLLEAVSWGLLGTELVAEPEQVPNIEALGKGMTDVLVGLEFVNGERLERQALFSCVAGEVTQEAWSWRLIDVASGQVIDEGNVGEDFADQQERLFPETCVHANLINGPALRRAVQGGRSGVERAVNTSNNWCTSDLSLRCAIEATGLFLALCPEAKVDALAYDPEGRLEMSMRGPLTETEVHLALLSHAVAFAKENTKVCPIFLDDPFDPTDVLDRTRLFQALVEWLPSRQVVFLLSDHRDIAALRSTGTVDKELEIRG